MSEPAGTDIEALGLEVEAAASALVESWLAAADGDRPVISAAQLRALGVIEQRPGLSLAELAEQLGTIASWASRLCDRLEADGYMERVPAAHGRRRLQLYLLPDGRAALDGIRRRRREAMGRVLAAMTAQQRRSLLAGLRAYRRAVSATGPARPAGRLDQLG
ncbi:MAG TPA: MarR family transcriptional regulator [Acidimicrobiales bacterium]|nr:MarR family transcriptional regulator [Acidimicrobiales bacterium]